MRRQTFLAVDDLYNYGALRELQGTQVSFIFCKDSQCFYASKMNTDNDIATSLQGVHQAPAYVVAVGEGT